jgi:hypothetical protein
VGSDERVLVAGVRHCNSLQVRWLDDSTLEIKLSGALALDWLDDTFRDVFGVRTVNVVFVLE